MSDLDLLFSALVESPHLHATDTAFYRFCKPTARAWIEVLFSSPERVDQPFGPFGKISLPYTRMGNIDSLDLFGLDELIIFAFYHANRSRYRRVLDIGANIGLHSMVMARCGFDVRAFEPDPWHHGILAENLAANGASSVDAACEAVSIADGEAQFVRVLGNTTGSHLAGSKDSYGEREYFKVRTRAVRPLFQWADLAKIDIEGHERELLLETTAELVGKLDVLVEIGNAANGAAVFDHFQSLGIGMFPQKIGWARASSRSELPTSHREGSLFISRKTVMPWRD